MAKLTTGEKIALTGGIGLLGLLAVCVIMAFGVCFWGAVAFVLMNYLLPLFDVNYPLTVTQALGAGAALICVRMALSGLFSVSVSK